VQICINQHSSVTLIGAAFVFIRRAPSKQHNKTPASGSASKLQAPRCRLRFTPTPSFVCEIRNSKTLEKLIILPDVLFCQTLKLFRTLCLRIYLFYRHSGLFVLTKLIEMKLS
jgi:hypothetical protein